MVKRKDMKELITIVIFLILFISAIGGILTSFIPKRKRKEIGIQEDQCPTIKASTI